VSSVFGYACMIVPVSPRSVQRWRLRIAAYCATEGLALELVFIDNGTSETTGLRPGWAALLDVLGLHNETHNGPHRVLLPGLSHLSTDPATASRMRAQLDHAGAMLTLMPGIPPHRRPRDRTGHRPA
jgi:hypothetical protein